MGLLEVFVTAAIQAVTTLLPIGWSGHLLLLSTLTGWPGLDGPATLCTYVGMALAIACYFWRDVAILAIGGGQLIRGKRETESRLLLFLFCTSLPVLAAALVADQTRFMPSFSLTTVGWISLGFGIFLYVGDTVGVTLRRLNHMTGGNSLLIGFAQVLALIPGSSRCGIAVTVARLLGYERTEAIRFALLLALPVFAGMIALTAFHLVETKSLAFGLDAYVAGFTAFVFGLVAIAFTMGWLERRSFAPFALYRVLGGAALLGWIYFG